MGGSGCGEGGGAGRSKATTLLPCFDLTPPSPRAPHARVPFSYFSYSQYIQCKECKEIWQVWPYDDGREGVVELPVN